MTDDPRTSTDLLARARRAWSPSAADAERVRRAIGAALGGGTSGAAPRQPPLHAQTVPWLSKVLLAGAFAAASGGVGYWASHRAGPHDARPPTRPAEASAAVPFVEAKPPVDAPRAAEPPPPESPPPAPARHDARGAHRRPAGQTPPETGSLATEVVALRNAERALRDGSPDLALAFLEDLDRDVPKGQLIEERTATATIARCTLGEHADGVKLAQKFSARHPNSVYRARVTQACAATDSTGAGDSRIRRSER